MGLGFQAPEEGRCPGTLGLIAGAACAQNAITSGVCRRLCWMQPELHTMETLT